MLCQEARLEPLKTLHEARASEEFGRAWVVEIPTQLANKAWSLLKPIISTAPGSPTQHHLRRLVTKPHLPSTFRKENGIVPEKCGTIFLLLPTCQRVSEDSVNAALRPHIPDRDDLPKLFSATVPLYPPTTLEQAEALTANYWPCVFNPASRTIQQAPPLHLLRATQAELDTIGLNAYIQLAQVVGKMSVTAEIGRNVGAVVVDPVKNEVVAAAGDARWWTCDEGGAGDGKQKYGEGRPEQHAMMRVIGMVARKELRRESNAGLIPTLRARDLNGRSLNPLELAYLAAPEERDLQQAEPAVLPAEQSCGRLNPYLCNGLDVYLTHEPCVCCSMAMMHSRFRACIFLKSMPSTGGLCAESRNGGLGYGLFWRKELNWRVMTFQYRYVDSESADSGSTDSGSADHGSAASDSDADNFHA